jgi:hypothetical protein
MYSSFILKRFSMSMEERPATLLTEFMLSMLSYLTFFINGLRP